MPDSFRINSPNVVAETLDGETTIVNLESGTYYALNQTGSAIWDRLVAGRAQDQVAGEIAEAFGIDGDAAGGAVQSLVDELRSSGLIVAGANGGSPSANGSSPDAAPVASWIEPRLTTYTDMQELLLLDPIHEVDESGWPNQPTG